MTAVRIRKENQVCRRRRVLHAACCIHGRGSCVCLFAQVYSADEKRALAQFNYEEKVPTPCDAQHAAYKHGACARRARAPTSSVLVALVSRRAVWMGRFRALRHSPHAAAGVCFTAEAAIRGGGAWAVGSG